MRVLAVPKSVKSKVEVEVEPGLMEFELPLTITEAVGGAGVVEPDVTAPGATKLDNVPFKASPLSVAFFGVALSSIKFVSPVLIPPATPWLKW